MSDGRCYQQRMGRRRRDNNCHADCIDTRRFIFLLAAGDQGNATTDTAAFSSPSVTPATGGADDARRRLVHGQGTVDVLPPIACHGGTRGSCSGFGVCWSR